MELCSIHDDHSPSLSVNRKKRVWHCFGYGKGGGISELMREMSLIPRERNA